MSRGTMRVSADAIEAIRANLAGPQEIEGVRVLVTQITEIPHIAGDASEFELVVDYVDHPNRLKGTA